MVGGSGLVLLTHWIPFDPLAAIAAAFAILWSGGQLVWRSAAGLLDYSDPQAGRLIRERLDAVCSELNIRYHEIRFRNTGYRQIIEVHLLFPDATTVGEAHRMATILEAAFAEGVAHAGGSRHPPGTAGRPTSCSSRGTAYPQARLVACPSKNWNRDAF